MVKVHLMLFNCVGGFTPIGIKFCMLSRLKALPALLNDSYCMMFRVRTFMVLKLKLNEYKIFSPWKSKNFEENLTDLEFWPFEYSEIRDWLNVLFTEWNALRG